MSDQEWYYMEGIPGMGDRPDFLESKYKSLADQAKAYKEARAELGRITGSVPETYDTSKYADLIDPQNPHLQGFLDFAKEKRLSQEVVDKAMGTLLEYEKSLLPDETLDEDTSKKKTIVENWAKSNFSQEALNVLNQIPKTPQVVKMLDEIRQAQYAARSQPPTQSNQYGSVEPLTEQDIRQEIRDNAKKYLEDGAYRNAIRAKLAQVLGEA